MTKLYQYQMTPAQLEFYNLLVRRKDWKAIGSMLEAQPELARQLVYLDHYTASYAAADEGTEESLAVLRRLLEGGLSPNWVPEGGPWPTPLSVAVWKNNLIAVELLLQFGADPNQADRDGHNALHRSFDRLRIASSNEVDTCLAIMDLLLKNGANPGLPNREGNSALHLAYGQIFICRYFIALHHQEPDEDEQMREALRDKEIRLRALLGLVERLPEHGGDPELRNKYGRTPKECEREGVKADQESSLSVNLGYVDYADDLPDQYHQAPTNPDGTFFFRRRPSDLELAASVELMPDHWLLPPASSKVLDELDQRLHGRLPKIIRELYEHHGGLEKQALRQGVTNMPSLRLMRPEEVMDLLWSYAQDDLDGDVYLEKFNAPWNDGRRTCFFWTDDGECLAGMFIDGPLKGKIYTWDAGETVAPYPEFKSVASYYRYLTADLAAEKNGGQKLDISTDYPSLDRSTENPADLALSRKLRDDWDKGGREDEYLGVTALYLSGVDDSEIWFSFLPSLLDRPYNEDDVPYCLAENICGLLEYRQYPFPLPCLIQIAESEAGLTWWAVRYLERLGTAEARKALKKIKAAHNIKG